MRRNRYVMNTLRSQIRPLEGNPSLPGGILPPSVAWLESNCTVTPHDYGNGNVQYSYVCEHVAAGGVRYRCTWTRWNNSNALQLLECRQLAPRPHYHEVHGGSEGPQGYAVLPPYTPLLDESLSLNFGAIRPSAAAQTYHYGRWSTRSNPGCPAGQEECGSPTQPGGPPVCCDIEIQGPRPVDASRRRLSLRDRLRLSYRLLFTSR